MRQTNPNSIQTFNQQVKPNLSERQRQVMEVMNKFKRLTSYEVALKMGVELHTISGRFSEISKLGLIKRDGTRKIKDSNFTVWEVVEEKKEIQTTLF
jgi:predicted HTH transcriptional regulator